MNYTHRDLINCELNAFLTYHNKGRVLEVGAGGNDNPNAISAESIFRKLGMEYIGIDMHSSRMDIIKMDAHKLDFPDESFDLVFLCHVFEHLENPIQALREFKRVLKKGGWLWMATPNPCEHHIIKADLDHIFVLEPMQMMKLLSYAGFSAISYKQYFWEKGLIPKEQDLNVISIGEKC